MNELIIEYLCMVHSFSIYKLLFEIITLISPFTDIHLNWCIVGIFIHFLYLCFYIYYYYYNKTHKIRFLNYIFPKFIFWYNIISIYIVLIVLIKTFDPPLFY